MRINHNISAMNANRYLNINNSAASKTLEKLSSGKRINRAGDDAAGMAISEKMRAQVNGLKVASRNSLDGVSLVQTAEGAMNEIHSMLQRMRELSVQAANGTSADSDRMAIQDEINQLTSEVNRISNGTEYNTRKILKGNEGPDSSALVHRMSTGSPAQYTAGVDLTGIPAKGFNLASEQLSIFVDGEEKVVNLTGTNDATTLNNFMDLVNDALGTSAKAILNKDGKMEISTTSIGGTSNVEIKGSTTVLTKVFGVSLPAQKTADNDLGTSVAFDTATNIAIDSTLVTLNNIKALGASYDAKAHIDNVVIELQKDINAVPTLNGKYTVSKDASGTKLMITSTEVGATAKVDLTGSATPKGADLLGYTTLSAVTGSSGNPSKAIGKAENATNIAKGSFYMDKLPDVGATIKIGKETIEFFDSSKAPYIGSNRPIDINGKATPEDVVKEIVNKFATGIEGVKLSQDGAISGAKSNNAGRLVIEYTKPGFDGNLVYLEATPKDFTTTLQVGANTGQEFRLQIGDIRAKNLKISADNPTRNPGVKGASYVKTGATVTDGISSSMVEYAVDVTSQEKASAAIKVFDNAIVQIAGERSKLGATQNRLEHTIANLDNTDENLTAAMSRIEDTDMALEMANFQKLNVLQQAGTSMLAQANQQPQSILKLLQG